MVKVWRNLQTSSEHEDKNLTAARMFASWFTILLAVAPSIHANFNPDPPPQLTAHVFLFGDGKVPLDTTGTNPFSNNALHGKRFLKYEMGFNGREIRRQKQLALDFWLDRFGVDGAALEAAGNASVIEYQISPRVNERAYLVNQECETPAAGHRVLDGGFQLLITARDGVPGFDPVKQETVIFPYFTNLVFSWLRIQDCLDVDIVLPYKSASLATFSLSSIIFELDIGEHPNNPFGRGKLLGTSAPIVDTQHGKITNRLLNYIRFDSLDD